VRRVAITLELAGIPYTNLPLRTVGDAAEFARFSPLKRAPTLVIEGDEPLFDSHVILAYLGERFPEVAGLWPDAPAQRLRCYQVLGAATGLADKAVSGVYERVFHPPAQRHAGLLARLRGQYLDTLAWLEQRAPARDWLCGERLTQADIAVGAALRFLSEAHPGEVAIRESPRLFDWWQRLESLPVFAKTYLALDPPQG
jgi:glutathione S-transferase